ncbi:MAG: methyl-accepting chemotaxis sensory transducer with Pas/Pac sensor, partial [Proteobacteria bacterium]|nr:methyl-accepting chemotaxis sensory transducer with Pas/Pac sensor [Pseudomonadota bacterium]
MSAERFKLGMPVLIFLLVALGIAGLGYVVFQQQVSHLKESAQKELATIATLKSDQITRWRSERMGDAQVVSRAYFFASAVAQWFQDGSPPDERRRRILEHLTTAQRFYDYRDIELLDQQGALRLSTATTPPTPSTSTRRLAAEAMRTGTILFSDIHRAEEEPGQPICLDVFAPLFDASERLIGAMVFRIDPDRYLFPLIQSWPTLSATAETLLVERQGNDVLYLNALQHTHKAALALRVPISKEKLPAAMAVRGFEGQTEGVDYHNDHVLAAIRKIPGSPWFMIAKVDMSEVYAPVHERTLLTAQFTVVLIAFAASLTALWWREKSARMVAREFQIRLERQALIQHFNYLAKYANDIILLFDSEFRIVEMNDRALEAYGYTREELLGRHISELRAPEKAAEFDRHRQQLEERTALVYETQDLRKDKTVFPVEVSSRMIETEGRTFYQNIVRDITERKLAEERLRSASLYTRSLIEASLDPLVTISADGYILDVNEATINATGVSRDGLIGSDFSDYFTEPERARAGYREVFAKGAVTDYPLAIRHVSGKIMDVLYNATVYRDEKGEVAGVFAAARDVTERKRAEHGLRESEQKYRSIVDTANEGIWVLRPDTMTMFVNVRMAEMLGCSCEEMIGRPVTDFMFAEDAPDHLQKMETRRQGLPERFERRFRRKDGETVWTLASAAPIFDAEHRFSGSFAMFTDITERKLIEERLRSASRYTRSLIEASLDPLVTISADGYILDVNEATIKATGVSRDGLIGSDFSDYFTEPEKARAGYQEVFAKGFVTDYSLAIRHVSGRIMDVLYNASVYHDEEGAVAGAFAAARDVTERKRAEAAVLAERQRFNDVLNALPVYLILL